MTTISSNHESHNQQVLDALNYLKKEHPFRYKELHKRFPEIDSIQFDGAWIDTASMGVDIEWPMWLTDAIEDQGVIVWMDGEPYVNTITDVYQKD